LITLAEIESNQGETNMKKQNLFIMTALVIGLTACGGNDEQPVANPNPYTPGSYYCDQYCNHIRLPVNLPGFQTEQLRLENY
jgi:hypothetical protein